jgi:hypothetical protein
MFKKSVPPQPNPDGSPEKLTLTLEPLRTDGQAALAPDTSAGIVYIALCKVVLLWHNAFNEVTIRQADDLFACAAKNGRFYDPIPKGADLAQATLDIQFAESPEPHTLDIIPPHSLTFQNPADAPRLLPLLARRGFSAAQKLALALLLAAACAPDPSFAATDNDDDDGDDPSESRHLFHPAGFTPRSHSHEPVAKPPISNLCRYLSRHLCQRMGDSTKVATRARDKVFTLSLLLQSPAMRESLSALRKLPVPVQKWILTADFADSADTKKIRAIRVIGGKTLSRCVPVAPNRGKSRLSAPNRG